MDSNTIPVHGKKKPYLGREEYFQEAATSILKVKYKHLNYFHVPNEGKRTAGYNAKLKRQGLKSGVSDIIILTPNKHYRGLAIELKVRTGKTSDNQKAFLLQCLSDGYYACVCYSTDSLLDILARYVNDEVIQTPV